MAYPVIEVQFFRLHQCYYYSAHVSRREGPKCPVIRHEFHGSILIGVKETDAQAFIRCTQEFAVKVKVALNKNPLRSDEDQKLPGL